MALGLLQSGPPLGPPGFAPQVPYMDPRSPHKYTCEAMGGKYSGYCRSPGGSTPFQGPTPCVRYCHMPGGNSVDRGNGWYPPLNTLEGLGAVEAPTNKIKTALYVIAAVSTVYLLIRSVK